MNSLVTRVGLLTLLSVACGANANNARGANELQPVTSYGTDGRATFDLDATNMNLIRLQRDDQDRVYALMGNGTSSDAIVVRFTADGKRDATFGNNGVRSLNSSASHGSVSGAGELFIGEIGANFQSVVNQYDVNGALSSTLTMTESVEAVALEADGHLILGALPDANTVHLTRRDATTGAIVNELFTTATGIVEDIAHINGKAFALVGTSTSSVVLALDTPGFGTDGRSDVDANRAVRMLAFGANLVVIGEDIVFVDASTGVINAKFAFEKTSSYVPRPCAIDDQGLVVSVTDGKFRRLAADHSSDDSVVGNLRSDDWKSGLLQTCLFASNGDLFVAAPVQGGDLQLSRWKFPK